MKKTLLTLVLALAFGVTCSAAVVLPTPKVKRLPLSTDSRLEFIMVPELAENSGRNQVAPLSRATESMNFTLADDDFYAYVKLTGVVKGDSVASLMEFDKANTVTFAGNEITAFFVYSPVNGELENENTIRNATVFITEDLGEEPFYTQDVRFGYKAKEKNFFPLEEAYKIEAGKPFFIGIKYTVSSNYDYYFPIDYLYHDSDAGGYCGVCKQGETEWTWNNLTSEIGFICQGVTITGDNLPHDDADIVATSASMMLTKDKADNYLALVRNNAANEISNVEVTTQVGNQAPCTQTIDLDSPIGYGSTSAIAVDFVCENEGVNIPMTSTITKINGQPNNNTSSYTTLLNCIDTDSGYPRKVVIEEATGTWCGWCPLGYSTMEAMREYDDVVPVAVHAGSYDEPMLSETYSTYAHENFTGYPGAIMNRYLTVNIQSLETVKSYYETFKSVPAVAEVSLSFKPNDDWSALDLTASATFGFDFQNNNVFQFAYVLTENNVGPYEQQNYASGQSSYPEWSDKPNPVSLYFNDVARDIKDVYGFSNSLPDNITKGQTVTHSTTMSTANVSDVKNMNVAVYLINTYTGAIENAAMIKAADVAGVTNAVVEDDNVTVTTVNGGITVEGDVENVDVYGIDGRHVAHSKAAGTINLAGGLYIVKANDTTVKVVVK